MLSAVRNTIPIGIKTIAMKNSTGSIDDAVTSNSEADIFCCINGLAGKCKQVNRIGGPVINVMGRAREFVLCYNGPNF